MRRWMKRGLSMGLTAAMLASCVSGFGTEAMAEGDVEAVKAEEVTVEFPEEEGISLVSGEDGSSNVVSGEVKEDLQAETDNSKEEVSSSAKPTSSSEPTSPSELTSSSEPTGAAESASHSEQGTPQEEGEDLVPLPEFKILKTEAKPDAAVDKIRVTITVAADDYSRLFVGAVPGTPEQIVELSKNQNGYQFTFLMGKDSANKEVLVTPQSQGGDQWLSGDPEMVTIPAVEMVPATVAVPTVSVSSVSEDPSGSEVSALPSAAENDVKAPATEKDKKENQDKKTESETVADTGEERELSLMGAGLPEMEWLLPRMQETEWDLFSLSDTTFTADQAMAADADTVISDGLYDSSGFTYEGGSKTVITCGDVEIKDGKAYAVIQLSSDKITSMKVGDTEYPATIIDGKAQAEIPVTLNAPMKIESYTTAMGGKWLSYTITVTLDNNAQAKFDNRTEKKDGEYAIAGDRFTFNGGTGKVKITCGGVEIKNGKTYAMIQFSSKNYEKIRVGGMEYPTEEADGKMQARIPVKLNQPMPMEGYTVAMGKPNWISYEIQITLSDGDKPNDSKPDDSNPGGDNPSGDNPGNSNPGTDNPGGDNPGTDNPGGDNPGNDNPGDVIQKPDDTKLADGKYSVEVESDAAMFKVTKCELTIKSGKIAAAVTLSGTGYGYLYPGTSEEASAADKSNWIPYQEDSEGKYTYTLPLTNIDEPVKVAAYSTKNAKWYDRTLTFKKDTMSATEEGNNGNTGKPDESTGKPDENTGNNNGNTGKPDGSTDSPENKKDPSWSPTVGGSTSGINSSTSLADGTYTPDKFSFSGGSGRVSISCPRVTVRGGQAYATIVFDSGSFSYVKANGRTYYGSNTGGTSTFEIPVQLNQNNTVIGCTTKMSAAHEVTYSIFVYIEGAAAGTSGSPSAGELSATELSKQAPEIAGLRFAKETETKNAQYYKIFNYEGGISCIEVDLGTNTEKKKAAEAAKEEDRTKKTEDAEETEAAGETAGGTDKLELYDKEIIRYLVVPAGVEIPAGLDKEMVVIRRPDQAEVFRSYVASENVLRWMDELGQLEQLTFVGVKEEDCEIAKVKELLKEGKLTYGGAYDSMEYKKFVQEKCNLVIVPGEMIPTEAKAGTKGTIEEQYESFMKAAEYCDVLDIPMFVDRSSQEKTEKGKLEWLKVYGMIFGCEDAAEALYQAKEKGL